MKENIVLIGAGSAMFTRGTLTDLIKQVTEIIDSIRKDAGRIYSANLPLNAVIEANGIANASGIKHIAQKPLPDGSIGSKDACKA